MDDLKALMTREHVLGTAIHTAYMTRTESEVGPYLRDKAMKWILVLNDILNFPPETFALTVHIFDTFLLTVKVKVNYLRCVAITAYFLSIKAVEEDENIPLVFELLEASKCGCRKVDVLKMEKIILLTLKWKIHIATPLTFLHQLYRLLVINITGFETISANILTEAEEKLQECMCQCQMTQFKNSVLSLAVLEIKLKEILDKNNLLQVRNIRQISMIESSEVERCQLLIRAFDCGHDINKFFYEIPVKVNETTLVKLPQNNEQETCLITNEKT